MTPDLSKPLAILADVRSNLAALEAVMADVANRGVKQSVIIGDLLAFGPDPREVADLLFDNADHLTVLLGHPSNVILVDADSPSNPSAQRSSRWARERLRPGWWQVGKRRRVWQWLHSLPAKLVIDGALFVCGTPLEPLADFLPTIDPHGELTRRHLAATPRVAFVGTISQPGYVNESDYRWRSATDAGMAIQLTTKTIVCPGGIGQPRDRDVRAAYAILDGDRVEWVRVPYDIEKTIARFPEIEALDRRQADRLRVGQ